MSNKKKPVGMAFDITTGKSYKVYKPESLPVSEQIPPEFEWIKPGVKMANKDCPNHRAIAQALPHWAKNHACWLVAVDGGGHWQCDIAITAEQAPITLTMNREQADAITDILADVLHYGPSVELEELKKQIEEKLK